MCTCACPWSCRTIALYCCRYYLILGWSNAITTTHFDTGVQTVLYQTVCGTNRFMGVPPLVAAAWWSIRKSVEERDEMNDAIPGVSTQLLAEKVDQTTPMRLDSGCWMQRIFASIKCHLVAAFSPICSAGTFCSRNSFTSHPCTTLHNDESPHDFEPGVHLTIRKLTCSGGVCNAVCCNLVS